MSKEEKKRVRRTHTREFKAETGKLVRSGGRNASQVARELGLADSLAESQKLATVLAYSGVVVGMAGLIIGAIQLSQGIEGKSDSKMWLGIGTMMVSAQPVLEMAISRLGPRVLAWGCVHMARFLGIDAALSTMLAVGGTLASIASIASVVGGIIVIAYICYSNKKTIMAILEDLSMPGSKRLCMAYLKYIEGSKVFNISREIVKTSHRTCVDELRAAWFIEFIPGDSAEKALRAIGMSEADFQILRQLAKMPIPGTSYSSEL